MSGKQKLSADGDFWSIDASGRGSNPHLHLAVRIAVAIRLPIPSRWRTHLAGKQTAPQRPLASRATDHRIGNFWSF